MEAAESRLLPASTAHELDVGVKLDLGLLGLLARLLDIGEVAADDLVEVDKALFRSPLDLETGLGVIIEADIALLGVAADRNGGR